MVRDFAKFCLRKWWIGTPVWPLVLVKVLVWLFDAVESWVGRVRVVECVLGGLRLLSQVMVSIWVFPKIGGFPPKSSICIGISIIFTIHFGVPQILGNTHIFFWFSPKNWGNDPIWRTHFSNPAWKTPFLRSWPDFWCHPGAVSTRK